MKKLSFITAATALIALTACQNTEDFSQESLQEAAGVATAGDGSVQFSTYMGRNTRATGGNPGNQTTESLKNAGFGVMAYLTNTGTWASAGSETAPNFMYNEKVTFSDDHWTYSNIKYWPNDFASTAVDNKQGLAGEPTAATGSTTGGKVSFFAYAPYVNFKSQNDNYTGLDKSSGHKLNSTDDTAFDVYTGASKADDGIVAVTTNAKTGDPYVKYVMSSTNSTAANNVDLLWGTRGSTYNYNLADGNTDSGSESKAYNTDLTKQTVDETVDFLFKHALAKIGGHSYVDPTNQSGLQVVLDIDNGTLAGSVSPSTSITGGVKADSTLVTISSIQIKDEHTFNSENTSSLVTAGWFDLATGIWSENTTTGGTYSSEVTTSSAISGGGAAGYALNPQIKEGTPAAVVLEGKFSKWQISSTDVSGVTTTPQNVYENGSNAPALWLIPSSADQSFYVTVTYIVRTYDQKLDANVASSNEGTWTKVTQTITNRVTIPGGSLKSNTYYKLLLHLGLTSVKFSAEASAWDEASSTGDDNSGSGNDKEIYLPSNTITTSTSASVAAATGDGNTITVYATKDSNSSFTITVSGLKEGVAPTATVADGGNHNSVSAGDASSNVSTVTVDLKANTASAAKMTTVTVTGRNVADDADVKAVINIIQLGNN